MREAQAMQFGEHDIGGLRGGLRDRRSQWAARLERCAHYADEQEVLRAHAKKLGVQETLGKSGGSGGRAWAQARGEECRSCGIG
jgi:hypothetical protein